MHRQGKPPFALIDLASPALASDQIYDVVLDLVVPTTPRNINLGARTSVIHEKLKLLTFVIQEILWLISTFKVWMGQASGIRHGPCAAVNRLSDMGADAWIPGFARIHSNHRTILRHSASATSIRLFSSSILPSTHFHTFIQSRSPSDFHDTNHLAGSSDNRQRRCVRSRHVPHAGRRT